MKRYDYDTTRPAILNASRGKPWRCPWCGEETWIVSDGNFSVDRARVEMYCDNEMCDSRETDVIITRGFIYDYSKSAHTRADVCALYEIDRDRSCEEDTGIPGVIEVDLAKLDISKIPDRRRGIRD